MHLNFINNFIKKINLNFDNDNDEKEDCKLVQNYQLLDDKVPESLKSLPCGIYPENLKYNTSRLNYNKLQNYYPSAIFYPKCEKELSYLVRNMVRYNLVFSTRCGARAYEPASLSNGFVIDVGRFNNIEINQKDMVVRVGSGVRLGDLINELAKKRLVMTTGDSSCVGVSGLSLAGGKGYLSRLYGMTCDNIISAKMIDCNGKSIKACNKKNSDLLYALKGSGHGSYGIVTELKFNIYKDIYMKIITLTWNWSSDTVFKILEFYQIWILNKPNNITTDLNMTYSNGTASFYIKFFKFYKSKKNLDNFPEVEDFINLIPNIKPTITINIGYYTQLLNILVINNTGESYPFSKMKSIMVSDKIISHGINLLIESINLLIKSQKPYIFLINFTQLGGAVSNYDKKLSCYFPRDALFVITILNTWANPELTLEAKLIPTDLYNNLTHYTSDYCLPNMIDYDLVNYLNSYYGTNVNTLITTKNKYDHKDIFNWKQSIPLSL
jgi:hypothetical protein